MPTARRTGAASAGVILAGDSPHAARARLIMAVRKDRYGPTGLSVEGLARVVETTRRRVRPLNAMCRWGHRYTPQNTYIDPTRKQRQCRACLTVRRHRRRWARLQQTKLDALKKAMLAAHPDAGGTARRFIAARRRYLQAKARRQVEVA